MKTSRLAATANLCGATYLRIFVPTSRNGNSCFLKPGPSLKHFAAALCLSALAFQAEASSVNVAWNPNPESDIAGYRLSYGTSPGSYSNTVATSATTSTTVSGLEEGRTYYFAVKAVNTAGLESEPSTEISHLVPTSSTTPVLPLIPNSGWQLVSASSQETVGEDGRAINAFDGNPDTFWHSQWTGSVARPPHTLTLDLGTSQSIQGFRYLPRQDGDANGHITQFEFLISADGVNWGNPVASGYFANNPSEKEVLFPASSGRYIRLRALSDGSGGGFCAVAELKLLQGTSTTTPANQAPVAVNQAVTTAEDRALSITLSATDADGQSLVYRMIGQPTKGRLSGTAPNLTYTPNTHVHGGDSFTFVANDGVVDSNVAAVSITITPVNDAPVAANQSLNATAGTPLVMTLAASDVDGNPLTYRVIGNPAQGTLSGTAPNLTYTPSASASGTDSFTFRANDGSADSNTATVSISISPASNTSLIALIPSTGWRLVSVSSQETTGEDGRAINAFDGNPDTFWHSKWAGSIAPPPHEILIDLGKSEPIQGFRYLPRQDGDSNGNVGGYEFLISSDGSNWGSPVASGSFANHAAEKEVLFTATSARYILFRAFNDASGKPFCCMAELKLLQGPVVDVAPPPNQTPVAAAQSVSTTEDKAVAIVLSASDADGDALTYTLVSNPSMGTLGGSAPNLTYTPAADANGSDSFTFRVSDGKANSNTASVSIAITADNDVPVAAGQTVAATEDKAVGIALSASDKDGDPLTYQIVSAPAKGTLSGVAPSVIYTPHADANGTDSFSFQVNDGTVNSNTASVSINITAVNDVPVATAQVVSTAVDKALSIVLSASDKDGDALTYRIISPPTRGALGGTAPNLTYTPAAEASGADSFSYRVNDGTVDSSTASVAITLTASETEPENKPPVFQSMLISGKAGTSGQSYIGASLAGSAIDPDGDSLTYSMVSGPAWLAISAAGELSGTPAVENEGLNSFTIRATDPDGAFAEATLQVEIQSEELSLPWSLARIGELHAGSTATGNSVSLIARSSGLLWGSADRGLFTWQTLSGDGEIIARITNLENVDSASRIGLMIRESLAPNSSHAFIGLDGEGSLRWMYRSNTGGSTSVSTVGKGLPQDLWVRLVRSGNKITASASQNGTKWSWIGRTTLYAGTSCHIGLAISGGSDSLSSAVFQNVNVIP